MYVLRLYSKLSVFNPDIRINNTEARAFKNATYVLLFAAATNVPCSAFKGSTKVKYYIIPQKNTFIRTGGTDPRETTVNSGDSGIAAATIQRLI